MENTQTPVQFSSQLLNTSQILQPNIPVKSEAPTNTFSPKKKFMLIILSILLLILFVDLRNINFPGSNIDDWQFSSLQNFNNSTNMFDLIISLPSKYISQYYLLPFSKKLIVIFSMIGFGNLPIGLYFLNFRFINWLVSKITKRQKVDFDISIKKSLSLVFIGVVTVLVFILIISKIEDLVFPLVLSGVINIILIIILWILSLLAFPFLVVASIINRKAKKSWQMQKLIIKDLAMMFNPIFLIPAAILFYILAYELFFNSYNSLLLPMNGSGINMVGTFSSKSMYAPTASTGISGGMLDGLGSFGSSMENVGLSAGGAKDINNFRENIKNDFFPVSTDMTYEGLFYDYFFDTSGESDGCTDLFCPKYSYAHTNDPISGESEHYLSVGLTSNISEADFQRKKLNLVIVMDISGSMSSSFDSYYYDNNNKQDKEIETKSKMQVANESVVALLDHLNPDDRYGMVLFDDSAYIAKPLNVIGNTDMESIKNHILKIKEQGSTNMEAGYETGTALLERYANSNKNEYENRIIFLTDAQPNTGVLDEGSLYSLAEKNAQKGIYTTFIGVGVDFNSELIEAMTKVKGANYYTVNSTQEFMERMDEGFEYMVTPLVFDLELLLSTNDFEIEKVYGSPEADEATGQIMKVSTLFPSKNEGGEVRGGVILLKLKPKNGNTGVAKLTATYQTRSGQVESNSSIINISREEGEFYGNSGIQKAIVLTRYINLLKFWIEDERKAAELKRPVQPRITADTGIIIPSEFIDRELSQWERQSVKLTVSSMYGQLLQQFRNYFELEMNVLQDKTMIKELEIIDKLIKKSGFTSNVSTDFESEVRTGPGSGSRAGIDF